MNWKQLKDFCNELTEEQLEKKVVIWREDEAIGNINHEVLEEPYYIDEESPEDGCISESEILSIIKNNPDEYPNVLGDFKKVYDKGHPLLWEKF